MRKAQSDTRRRRRYQVTLGAAVSFSIDARQKGSARKRCASWYLVTSVQGCIDGARRRVALQATSPGTLPAMRCSASAARMGISFGEVGLGIV
jgi:hypothetical protein